MQPSFFLLQVVKQIIGLCALVVCSFFCVGSYHIKIYKIMKMTSEKSEGFIMGITIIIHCFLYQIVKTILQDGAMCATLNLRIEIFFFLG